MDKKQAEAISQAILEPGLKAQGDARRKRLKTAARLAVHRRAAGRTFVGMVIGGTIGHFAYGHLAFGLLIGGGVAHFLARFLQSVLSIRMSKQKHDKP